MFVSENTLCNIKHIMVLPLLNEQGFVIPVRKTNASTLYNEERKNKSYRAKLRAYVFMNSHEGSLKDICGMRGKLSNILCQKTQIFCCCHHCYCCWCCHFCLHFALFSGRFFSGFNTLVRMSLDQSIPVVT